MACSQLTELFALKLPYAGTRQSPLDAYTIAQAGAPYCDHSLEDAKSRFCTSAYNGYAWLLESNEGEETSRQTALSFLETGCDKGVPLACAKLTELESILSKTQHAQAQSNLISACRAARPSLACVTSSRIT